MTYHIGELCSYSPVCFRAVASPESSIDWDNCASSSEPWSNRAIIHALCPKHEQDINGTRQLVASPENLVVAACRNPDKATTLKALKESAKGTLHIIQMDVSDFDSIRASVKQVQPILGDSGLDYLVNNAGIASRDAAFTLDPEQLLQVLRTNVAGPAVVSQVFLPFVEKGRRKVILNISSTLGSLQVSGERLIGTSYSMSKSALNMLTLKQKAERPDITFITMCPGWVRTDLGGKEADLDPEESIAGILKVISSVTNADSGKYLRYNGEEIPW